MIGHMTHDWSYDCIIVLLSCDIKMVTWASSPLNTISLSVHTHICVCIPRNWTGHFGKPFLCKCCLSFYKFITNYYCYCADTGAGGTCTLQASRWCWKESDFYSSVGILALPEMSHSDSSMSQIELDQWKRGIFLWCLWRSWCQHHYCELDFRNYSCSMF